MIHISISSSLGSHYRELNGFSLIWFIDITKEWTEYGGEEENAVAG